MHSKEVERKEKIKEWKKQDKELSKKEYNYMIIQKRYEQEIVLPELERVRVG